MFRIQTRRFPRLGLVIAVGMLAAVVVGPDARATEPGGARAVSVASSAPTADATASWRWPVAGPITVVAEFREPTHRYGPGHRGVDVSARGEVFTPADGVIAFVGEVAGRAVVTIEHAGDLVTTLEPVESSLAVGSRVRRGTSVGIVSGGGHTPAGALHFGVRWAGEYIDPMRLVDRGPRAVLLPCCE